jgi:hypothetical protein
MERPGWNTESAQLELSVDAGPGSDTGELERLAGSLRTELLELDVYSVEPATRGPAPDGTRAIEAVVVGVLVARLARSPEALAAVASTIRSWLRLHPQRRVRIELDGDVLELTGASDKESERLVDSWIARHGGS